MLQLKAIMFKFLCVWMTAYNSFCFSNFSEFLDLCYFSSPKLGVSLVYFMSSCVLGLRDFVLSIENDLLIQEKKEKEKKERCTE